MQHLEVEAPDALREVIKCFWYTSIDLGEQRSSLEVLPDGYAEIIFHFGTACSLATPEGLRPLPSPFVMGLLGQPARVHAQHRLQVIGIRCFPWTVFELLGLPPGKDRVYIVQHPIAQLHPRLAEWMRAGNPMQALAQAQQYFLAEWSRLASDRLLHKAGTAMREAGGTLPVSQVAAAAHATVRTLERKFKQSAGHTVKDVSALMRFEQVRNRLWVQPASNLAGLAQELGYTDQAHLSREFKRYSGTTPAAFARSIRRGEQPARDSDFVAFLQA